MNAPLVSVCLPSLNTFPYLRERVDTILGQTLTNWELIVIDSYSEDGSWELFERLAREDRRVSIAQAPRGLYASWNRCIERARGKYVYIATSDDTMASDCLEKLVAALEEHEDCDLAHCSLRMIDKDGAPMQGLSGRDDSMFARSAPEMLKRRHIRRAPYDGMLHLTGWTVYRSITELLIRRSLFSRIGGFPTTWGPISDFNWDMKAGLVANTIHVPDTWASWRQYPGQSTASAGIFSVEYAQKVGEMIHDAVEQCKACLAPQVMAGLKGCWIPSSSCMRGYCAGLRSRPAVMRRRLFQLSRLGERPIRTELLRRLRGESTWEESFPGEIREWLERMGVRTVVACES